MMNFKFLNLSRNVNYKYWYKKNKNIVINVKWGRNGKKLNKYNMKRNTLIKIQKECSNKVLDL